MESDIIEGFIVGKTVQLTIANYGHAIVLTARGPAGANVEATLSVEQSERLRRLLRAAERRASHA